MAMMKFITKVYCVKLTPRKLCDVRIAINYIHVPLSMAYDSTANFSSFGPTCTCFHVYQKNGFVKRSYVVFEILNLKQ